MATTSQARRLFGPLTLLAMYLVVSAYVRNAASVYPPNFGERDWRFGAFGFLLGDSPAAIMGLGLMVAAAALADNRGWLRGSSLAAAGFAVVSAAMLVSFWRDGSGLIAEAADPNSRGMLASAVRRTAALGVLNVLGFGAVAWGGMRAASGAETGDDPALAVSRKG